MRVLHISKTSDGAGWAAEQAAELAKLGVEVHVALPCAKGRTVGKWASAGAVIHIAATDLPDRSPWLLPARMREMRELVSRVRPDLIHTHFFSSTVLVRLALGAHHATPRVFQVPGPLHLEHGLWRRIELATSGDRDSWIASSRCILAHYRTAGIPDDRLYLSYYGTRISDSTPLRTGLLRERYGIADDVKVVGNANLIYPPKWYLGQRIGLKAHEDVIDALGLIVRQRPDVRGVLIGGTFRGSDAYERRLRERARSVGSGRILMTGYVPPDDIRRMWPDFDVAVHVPISENCGGVVESLMAAVPTIAGRVGGLPEVVIDGVTGNLVGIRDPQELARKVLDVIDSQQHYQGLARIGRKLVGTMFEVQRTALEVLEIYKHILDERHPPPPVFDSTSYARGLAAGRLVCAQRCSEEKNEEQAHDPKAGSGANLKILVLCTLDVMAWKLLLPWFRALLESGYEVHIACAKTTRFKELAANGFHMHEVPLRRRLNPLLHVTPFWRLYRIMRRERFGLVNTHSPVASAIGRLAAWFARVPLVVYTVHGFHFHDDMPRWKRRALVTFEWVLGGVTDSFMFVSGEDREVALREGIAREKSRARTICTGVDLETYTPKSSAHLTPEAMDVKALRENLNIPPDASVVGIVGRVVKEKGYIEFARMAGLVAGRRSGVYFLVVGDALPSDRDGMLEELQSRVQASGLQQVFRFTGFTDSVAAYLQMMDVFVLPSYREGFPRSILEAMSSGLPVVASNIRGCREAVVDGETGLLVPARDSAALAEAVNRLLDDPALASRMGMAGRLRAVGFHSQTLAQRQFVDAIEGVMPWNNPARTLSKARRLQRLIDVIFSFGALIVLAPLLFVIMAAVRFSLGKSPIIAQQRVCRNGRVFALYKFRTMTDARDAGGRLLSDAQRLTRLGRYLRETSLDELPQLWNVFKGDMSLVGPRPLLPEYLPRYTMLQGRRHEVRPGITGWAQVNGRNSLDWEKKFELDVWYVDNCSFKLDARILWMTAVAVIKRDGISRKGHATAPEFLGSD